MNKTHLVSAAKRLAHYHNIERKDEAEAQIIALAEKYAQSQLLQQTTCTTLSVPTDEQIDEMWEERNSSGTYLEGNICRREGAKKIRDMMLAIA